MKKWRKKAYKIEGLEKRRNDRIRERGNKEWINKRMEEWENEWIMEQKNGIKE